MKQSILFILLLVSNPCYASFVTDYFSDFYSNYLLAHNIGCSDREIFDILYKTSIDKVNIIEKTMLQSEDCNKIKKGISLINEEYYDLMENLNFEIFITETEPIKCKLQNQFKKAHNEFMCLLSDMYN